MTGTAQALAFLALRTNRSVSRLMRSSERSQSCGMSAEDRGRTWHDTQPGRNHKGEHLRVLGLARNVIRLSGRMPDKEIPTVFAGLVPASSIHQVSLPV